MTQLSRSGSGLVRLLARPGPDRSDAGGHSDSGALTARAIQVVISVQHQLARTGKQPQVDLEHLGRTTQQRNAHG